MTRHPGRWILRAIALTGVAAAVLGASASAASAHPLGNFTVNYYEGLTLSDQRVTATVVVDSAELPTYNRVQPSVDTNHDGDFSSSELSAYGARQCNRLSAELVLTVDGTRAVMQSSAATFALLPSNTVRGLSPGRLGCTVGAAADLTKSSVVTFDDHVDATYGWHEITAVGTNVHVATSSVGGADGQVAATSVSN